MRRRSSARDGYVAESSGFTAAPSAVWEAEASAPEDSSASPTYGQPVVAAGEVYLVNRLDRGPQRPMYGRVHALDVGDGDRRWASERLRSPSDPAIWGDLVVVVAENETFDAMMVAFDRADGTRQWTREFGARDRGVVAASDHLYLASGAATARGTLRAIDGAGATVWRSEGTLADRVTVGPTLGTDHVYAATGEGRLHALDRDDGTADWSHRFDHPTEQRPYVADLVATDCAVIAVVEGTVKTLDAGGRLVWESEGHHGSLATDGELLYTATGRGDDRELRAVHVESGAVNWTVSGPIRTPPVVAGDDIYVRLEESIVAIGRADGEERWRTDGSLDDLALANGTLYGTRRGTLLALR